MSHFLLIDSTTGSLLSPKVNQNVIATEDKELKVISEEAKTKVTDYTIIVINAEAKIEGEALQDSKAIELIYWFRCKYDLKNPIVIFSVFSLSHQLRCNPNHFVLVSPGCYFFEEIPVLNDSYKPKPLSALEDIKPLLKPKIDEILGTFRHRYANYSGMALMLEAAGIKPEDFEPLQKNERFSTFVNSLDYAILTTYFGQNSTGHVGVGIDSKKRILLVDDMAEEGWLPILRQLIYNNEISNKLDCVEIKTSDDGAWDEALTKNELEKQIKSHRPHLLLLDLRLGDEQGNKPIEELGGYKLLTFLKNDPIYKGVPVIMFTATTKADTVKTLLRAGATAVWTKPGIDEGLSKKEMVERHKQLLTLIDNIFNQFGHLKEVLNRGSNLKVSFEQIRIQFLEYMDWINYRCRLSENIKLFPTQFEGYTDIIIDTNFFISGNDQDFVQTFLKLYVFILNLRNKNTKHEFLFNSTNVDVHYPKIVILNAVLDELVKISKQLIPQDKNLWKRAQLAFIVLRSTFEKDTLWRTDLNTIKSQKPHYSIKKLKIQVADDLIIEEIKRILNQKEFTIVSYPNGTNNSHQMDKVKIVTKDPKVLILTDENTTDTTKIPNRIKAEVFNGSAVEEIKQYLPSNSTIPIYTALKVNDKVVCEIMRISYFSKLVDSAFKNL